MAYDKLVDSSQLNSDLGDVADAIRAKSGGSSQLAFPSGFISEIGNISTGGGGLPTGMTNIGSGSFTFASRTVLNTAINHGLSFTPRAVIVWTNAEPSAAETFYCLLTRQLASNTGTAKSERYLVSKASSATGLDTTMYSSTDAISCRISLPLVLRTFRVNPEYSVGQFVREAAILELGQTYLPKIM